MASPQAAKARLPSVQSPNRSQQYRWSDVAKLVINPPGGMQGARQKFRSMAVLQSRGPEALQGAAPGSMEDIGDWDPSSEAFDGDDGQRLLRRQLDSLKAVQHKERSQLRKLEACLSATELQERQVAKRMEAQRQQLEESKTRAKAIESRLGKLQALEVSKDKVLRRTWEPPPTRPTSDNACAFPVSDWSPVDMHALAQHATVGSIADSRLAEEAAYVVDQSADGTGRRSRGLGTSASAPVIFSGQADSLLEEVEESEEEEGMLGRTIKVADDVPSWLETPWRRSSQSSDSQGSADEMREEEGGGGEALAQPELLRSSSHRTKGSVVLPPPRYPVYTAMDPAAAMLREVMRAAMLRSAGGPRQAFKALDASGSGNVSMTEFEGGLRELGIPWQELTQYRHVRHVFRLFDTNRAGLLDYRKLFGQDELVVREKPDTPGFWQEWVQQNRDISHVAAGANLRSPKWQPDGPEEELKLLFEARSANEGASEKRAWMRSTIRRMKHRGKSDARCREIVASHLPRGTGPKDLEDVQTFSDVEVRACKRAYQDQVQEPVRNIQKVIYDMREQRRILQTSRQKLYTTAIEPQKKREAAEEAKQTLGAGLGGLLNAHSSKNQDLAQPDPATLEQQRQKAEREKAERQLAAKLKVTEDQIGEIHKEFCRVSGEQPTMDEERISLKQLRDVLKALHCEQALNDGDIEKAWMEMGGRGLQGDGTGSMPLTPSKTPRSGLSPHGAGGHSANAEAPNREKRKTLVPRPSAGAQTCNFETFVSWFIETDFFRNMGSASRL
mmetsp:Transcript_12294/g.27282  ORF Transcript_12294/g.27282 Transcript_12294/m.27282 type:complete len:785 (+) Transcript_12294:100-2454(+)